MWDRTGCLASAHPGILFALGGSFLLGARPVEQARVDSQALQERHCLGARALVEAFDRGAPVEPGEQIVLTPPSEERRLENMRLYHATHEKNKKTGKVRRTSRKQRSSDSIDLTLRSGIFARKV